MRMYRKTSNTTMQRVMCNKEEISRRRFLITGWFGFLGFLLFCLIITVIDFFKPKVLHEAPMIFKAGLPEEYLMGTVSTNVD